MFEGMQRIDDKHVRCCRVSFRGCVVDPGSALLNALQCGGEGERLAPSIKSTHQPVALDAHIAMKN